MYTQEVYLLIGEFASLASAMESLLEEISEGRVTEDNGEVIVNILSPLVDNAKESLQHAKTMVLEERKGEEV